MCEKTFKIKTIFFQTIQFFYGILYNILLLFGASLSMEALGHRLSDSFSRPGFKLMLMKNHHIKTFF